LSPANVFGDAVAISSLYEFVWCASKEKKLAFLVCSKRLSLVLGYSFFSDNFSFKFLSCAVSGCVIWLNFCPLCGFSD